MLIQPLADSFGRRFPYLRLSVTDVCNFRCTYCLPNGWQSSGRDSFLTLDEIRRLVTGFAALGMWKIRLTGGEPTVRRDFTQIVQAIHEIPGIRRIAFTTNGYRLKEHAAEWRAAGASQINVSIDSLDPQQFHQITGHDRLAEILDGIALCEDLGYDPIKINAVLLRGINDQALDSFLEFIRGRRVSIRFIELMETGLSKEYFQRHHISGQIIADQLEARGWSLQRRQDGDGPAKVWSHPDSAGTLGLIAPYSKDFCSTCNRLRVTARGRLRLCLFGDGGHDLRPLLASDDQQEALQAEIRRVMGFKRVSHFLQDGDTGATPHLASVGG